MEQRLEQIIAEKGAWPVKLETIPDHVHLLARMREELPWLAHGCRRRARTQYFVATVGGGPLSVIKRYVETQKDR